MKGKNNTTWWSWIDEGKMNEMADERFLRRERSFSEKFRQKRSIRELQKGSPSVSPFAWGGHRVRNRFSAATMPLSIIRYQPRLSKLDVDDEVLYDLQPWSTARTCLGKCFPLRKSPVIRIILHAINLSKSSWLHVNFAEIRNIIEMTSKRFGSLADHRSILHSARN